VPYYINERRGKRMLNGRNQNEAKEESENHALYPPTGPAGVIPT